MGNEKDKNISEDYFEKECWVDINGFTAKEWAQIRELAEILRKHHLFKEDPLKCIIGAFVIWINEGNGLLAESIVTGKQIGRAHV